MKLLLVTICLVVSVFAAPAEKTKRNILKGDPRYDAKLHQHHAEHSPQENEVEISKALGGFAGTFSAPDVSFDFSGLENGASPENKDFLQYNIDASKAAIGSDIVNTGDSKVFEQFNSVTESSFASPKIDSAYVGPAITAGPDVATSTNFDLLSRTQVVDGEKESSETANGTKVETKSASDGIPFDASRTAIKSVNTDASSAAEAFSSGLSLSTDRLATPFFGSSFDSRFASIGQSEYIPNFHSGNEYTPTSFDRFNTNYQYFNNYGGYPADFSTHSGFNQGFKSQTIDSHVPADFSQLTSIALTKNEPYLPPSSFSPLVSVSDAASTEFKFSPDQSYLSPFLNQPKEQLVDTVFSRGQQQLFENYSPLLSVQPTAASFQAPIQPEIKITEGSYSGISQLTDSNGGYIY